jgi:hypothetical protein
MQEPMEAEEVASRLNSGWRIAGQCLVSKGQGVATPDNPTGIQVAPCVVWVLPEPMIPVGEIFSTLFQTAETYAESAAAMLSLDFVSNMLFGKSVSELLEVTKQDETTELGKSSNPGEDAPLTMD